MNKKIKDDPNYVRTPSGFILNTNSSEYSLALKRRKHKEHLNERISQLEKMVQQLLIQGGH